MRRKRPFTGPDDMSGPFSFLVYNTSMPLIQSDVEMEMFARELAVGLHPMAQAVVLGLNGELGSGKTFFVKGLAKFYGITDIVSSPTFVLEKIYKLEKKPFDHLIHIDAYRLEKPEELQALGWDEIITNSRNLICVEWAERVEKLMPKTTRYLSFEHINETTRQVSFDAHGKKTY